ncbi:glycoside hydrolase family 43 protein [Paraglaciecola sp.]|uniref:glycoside hydrolase family 43 protein n=1 Tax=Paraglaciecola sp. TaxID=1920173 RepID=UPI00273D9AB4|nr:glycoside hydrolase family 43 protein [Paraglaciecola sp.]MDP5029875.1 glycoside hydrolase family 43 protein [Paraglaciecola sp.]
MGKILRFATLLVAIQVLFACGKHNQRLPADDVYIFSSFRGNGEDGLHLAYSQDGLNWQPLNKDQSVLTPQIGGKLLRDPCIILGPDNIFHMVWTTGWEDKGIGLAHSSDLINWSAQQYLAVMADFPTARNAWAPEITWDELTQQYFIYWASTIPGTYPQTEASADKGWDHRIFATTTKDFVHYTPTKLFYQPDFNVIDATITQVANEYVMIVKDETRYPPAKNLLVATGPSIEGPWLLNANPFSPKDTWVEGPSILTSHEGHYVYFDQYTEHRYGAMYTKDFQQWQDVSEHLVMPEGSRHGSALRVSAVQFNALQQLR